MNLLLISNSTNYGESYLAWAMNQIEYFCEKTFLTAKTNIVFIPFAGVNIGGKAYPYSYDAYESRVKAVFEKLGYINFHSLHAFEKKAEAIKNAGCIIVGGGNTFHLVAELHKYKLIHVIQEQVKNDIPYIGWSAGSNIACPTLCTTNDMPIVQPESFKALNLVPFQINPHYLDPHPEIDKMIKHGGETRQDRLNEYLSVNQNMKVVGLREATSLWIMGNKMQLKGGKKMVVFEYNKEAIEYEPGSDVSFLL